MRTTRSVPALALLTLLAAAPPGLAAQSVLVEAKTTAGNEVATIRTDSMRLLVPLHLLVGGLLFPDGTLQTTAAADATSVTSAEIVDGTIVDADISASAAIADGKLGMISTAGKVANSATTATSAGTPGAIVARDAGGGFEASFVQVADSLRVHGQGSFLATGTYDLSGTTVPPPVSGAGARMMWYPERAAFRAGRVSGTEWDAENIGASSTALGGNTTASGDGSTALGSANVASATGSTALGEQTTASGRGSSALGSGTIGSGDYSTASGYHTVASGMGSVALGRGATATSLGSVALGLDTDASGDYATALGYSTDATARRSTAFGYGTMASGLASTAMGEGTTASGIYSTSLGVETTAQAYASVVIGNYNVVEGTGTDWIATEPLFVAGNGTSITPSNALTLYKNGNLTIAGTLTQSSDARLKEGIEPLEGTLHRVLRLTPIRYHFRAGAGRPQGTQIGLTAQQVQPLFPELVTQDGDGYLSLSYANLSAVLVKAVQEQEAEIEELRAHNQRVEAELASLRQRNERLESELGSLRAAREWAEARVARLEQLVERLLSDRSTAPSTLPDGPR
ncbi:MAG: tail fiber domain-containing protein [Gemmatimonadota bacterium]|jgi:hypothetical protein